MFYSSTTWTALDWMDGELSPAAGQLCLQLTFQIGGDLVGVLVERHHHGRVALGVERLQIGASCHQHDADVAAILLGGNVQSCLTAKKGREGEGEFSLGRVTKEIEICNLPFLIRHIDDPSCGR